MEKKIPLVDLAAQHQSRKEQIRLAMDRVVLNTRFINGKELTDFEEDFAKFVQADYAVGVASGTDALICALRMLDIGAGDEVIVPTHTFIASGEAIEEVGAKAVFVEVDPVSFTLDVADVESKVTQKTKAIMPVHLYGNAADMDGIMKIARAHNLKVISDASQAHGAQFNGKDVSAYGDATCYSFYPGKNLGSYGDAGGVATNCKELADKIKAFRNHGRQPGEKYTHATLGINARMDTLQAAVLGVKLKSLGDWNEARRKVAARYNDAFKDLPIGLPEITDDRVSVFHLYVIRTSQREELMEFLKEKNIASGIHYPVPLHLQPAFSDYGHKRGDFPLTEQICEEIVSLPIFPELKIVDQKRVIAAVKEFFGAKA